MRWLSILVFLLWSGSSVADPWVFTNRSAVTPLSRSGVFHHLDSPGRKSIAVSGDAVAVVWEDNRSGAPQAYVAFKMLEAARFDKEMVISTGHEAYAPSVAALGGGRFLIAWEQDNAVWARAASISSLEPALRVDRSVSSQITLATAGSEKVIAAWCRRDNAHARVVTTTIDVVAGKPMHVGAAAPVDPAPVVADQLSPAVAASAGGVTVVWEDRREAHTILLYAHAPPGQSFSRPRLLNEPVEKSTRYGSGSGVTRAALVAFGGRQVAAAWMDKRNDKTAYDIYGAFSRDDGVTFGANELVQDAFAEEFAQWHPAIAGGMRGRIVVAWDDDRDGTSNIWYAWKTNAGWSGDHTFAAASGKGQQTNPSITLDDQNNLHVLWIDQETDGGPSRLFYARGRYQQDKD